jgi:type II secretory pathway component PulF
VVEATDKDTAIASLVSEGRFVVEIAEQKVKTSGGATGKGGGRISRGDLALFTRRMADLAAAGLPLDRALSVVAEQSESARLAEIIGQVLIEVRGGMPVSTALSMHPKVFPTVFTQTLRAGEASGQFPDVASRLAEFQEKEVTRRSQITSAMVYPAVLAGVAISVVTFVVTFVVPKLSDIFKDLGNDLPTPTKMLLAGTGFITKDYLFLIAGLLGLGFGYRAWAATESGAVARDSFFLRLPVIGPILQKAVVSRFARVLGTLVYGGVPILEAIRLSGLASGNRLFVKSAAIVENEVREGRPIADSMRNAGNFPPVLTHMVAVGEETGDLPKMLSRVSDSLDFEVDNGLRRLTSLVEPLIVLSMGAFVGFVVLAIALPIFQAQDLVK